MGLENYFGGLITRKQIKENNIKTLKKALEDFLIAREEYRKERDEIHSYILKVADANKELNALFIANDKKITAITSLFLFNKFFRRAELMQLEQEQKNILKQLAINNKTIHSFQPNLTELNKRIDPDFIKNEIKLTEEKIQEWEKDIAELDKEIAKETAHMLASQFARQFRFSGANPELSDHRFSDLELAQLQNIRIIYDDEMPKHHLRLITPRI